MDRSTDLILRLNDQVLKAEQQLLELKAERDRLRKALEEIRRLHHDSNGADFSPAMFRAADAALR